MIKRFFPIAIAITLITACQNNDNVPKPEKLLDQNVRNRVDDEAINLILNDYYLNENGKLTQFSDTDSTDDDKTPLSKLAKYHPEGYWTVKREDYDDSGRKVTDVNKDKILLQYDMYSFKGKTNSKEDSTYYSTPVSVSSTINTKGYPLWDPDFYYKELSDKEIKSGAKKEWFEIEGFQAGIKEFNSVNKEIFDTPYVDFQGLIIMPSRLAFGREKNILGLGSDQSIIFNFQLYQVVDRK